ncbi:ABC transporter substrate-binding protein [Lacisediminihabitans sp. FW035]
MNSSPFRHTLGVAAVVALTALVLGGCSSTPTPATQTGSQKPVTIRMVWWGSDDRAKVTNDAVAAFEKKHPNITVATESLPFDGYFDKLSTQVAANDAPDVQQLTGDYVVEYGSRGALLDITKVDLSDVDKATTKSVHLDDKQLGVPTGIGTIAIIANPVLFKQAGVEMPDDTTWTWDDYEKIAKKISKASPAGTFGSQALGTDSGQLAMWARQRGGDVFTAAGKVGFTAKDAAGFYTLTKRMVDEGAAPSADEASEQTGLALEQTGTATNRYAMGFWATNQLTSLEAVSKDGLKILRFPSTNGKVGGAKMGFGAAQYWSVASRSKHPLESQMLIDFLTNSTTAGKLLLVGRGSPVNSKVRDAVVPLLSESDAQIVNFIGDISKEVVQTPLAPAGSATFQENMRRYTSEVLFGRQTPEQAAKGLLDETKASLVQ